MRTSMSSLAELRNSDPFTVLIISVLPTFYDVSTDSLSAKSFINGANYTKHVMNQTDFGNCSLLGT